MSQIAPGANEGHKAGAPQMWLPWDTDRWQAYWIDGGPEDVLLFYCSKCAKRESVARPGPR